jgi:hypothetical protein
LVPDLKSNRFARLSGRRVSLDEAEKASGESSIPTDP